MPAKRSTVRRDHRGCKLRPPLLRNICRRGFVRCTSGGTKQNVVGIVPIPPGGSAGTTVEAAPLRPAVVGVVEAAAGRGKDVSHAASTACAPGPVILAVSDHRHCRLVLSILYCNWTLAFLEWRLQPVHIWWLTRLKPRLRSPYVDFARLEYCKQVRDARLRPVKPR